MILAEKKVLIAKKVYQSTVIQQKKNKPLWKKNKSVRLRKKWLPKPIFKWTLKNRRKWKQRRRFFLFEKKLFRKKFLCKSKKSIATRKQRLTSGRAKTTRKRARLKKLILLRALFSKRKFVYLKKTVFMLRFKWFFCHFTRRRKKKIWKRVFRKNFYKFFKKNRYGVKLVSYHTLIKWQKRNKKFYRFFKYFIKYAFIKRKLKWLRKKFVDRRKKKQKKFVEVDFSRSENLRFMNYLTSLFTKSGKKTISNLFFYKIILLLKFKFKTNFFKMYIDSLKKVRPLILFKTVYTGGKKYRLPVLMPILKSYKIAAKWIVSISKNSNETLPITFFKIISSSLKDEGLAVKQRRDHHALSFENKTYLYLLRFLKKGFA